MVIFYSYVKLPEGIIWMVVEPYPSEKYEVSWDDDIPNLWKKNKMSQTTNQ